MCKIYLKNAKLRVEILMPGTVYRQTRFDWMGMITQVTLNDKNTFCVSESLIPGMGTNGIGLCNEFGIEESIGYEEAKIGEKFPKLGVGLLTKFEEGGYKFHKDYKVEPFTYSFIEKDDSIEFSLVSEECRGYQVKQTKIINIKDNVLKINYCVENIGKKVISTTEYSHNFLGINNKAIGPGYKLVFSEGLEVEKLPKDFILNSNTITLNKIMEDEFYFRVNKISKEKKQYWELINEPSAVGIRETVDFEVERVAVWGKSHVISPEVFIKLHIEPGSKQEWSREFNFFEI